MIYHTFSIEIGTLGHWLQPFLRSLLSPSMSFTKRVAREVMDEAARKEISASEIIFQARADPSWPPSRTLLYSFYLIQHNCFFASFLPFSFGHNY